MLPIHEQLLELGLNNTQMVFDATSLYLSAMWDNKSVYPKKKLELLLNNIWMMFKKKHSILKLFTRMETRVRF